MELQDQIYVITGVSAGLFVLLFVCIGYLMYRLAKITEVFIGRPVEKRDTYAYNNPTIVQGEELNRRGFVMHTEPTPLTRDATLPAGLPRVEPSHGGGPFRDDFSSILNNQELVFGGDRPSNLGQRAQPLKPALSRGQGANLDYPARPPMANDNFSFQNAAEGGPKAYLNERMQY